MPTNTNISRMKKTSSARIGTSLAVAATEASTVSDLRTLATYLDLELVGLLAVPAALGAALRSVIASASIRAAQRRAVAILEEARQQQSALIIAAKGEIARLKGEADLAQQADREAGDPGDEDESGRGDSGDGSGRAGRAGVRRRV